MGQMLRQARSVGLKTVFMGPEGVGNASLSNIAGAAAEGMLVTMPKRYDQDPANSAIVDALKAEKKIRAVHMSGSPTLPCSHWRRRWTEAAARSRWT
jgi:ABC-type branched-subunit amino acid transport system substrate-binding protein